MADMSIPAFVAKMTEAMEGMDIKKHKALDMCGRIVANEAKRMLGHYQDDISPMPPWAQLAESTMEQRAKEGFPADEPLLKTGEVRDSIYHEVGHDEFVVTSDNPIAAFLELGTKRMPPRSFLAGAGIHKGHTVAVLLGQAIAKALVGEEVHEGGISLD